MHSNETLVLYCGLSTYDAGTEISGVSAPVVNAGLKLNMGRVNQAIQAPVTIQIGLFVVRYSHAIMH